MLPLWLDTQSIPIKRESHKNRPSEPHRVQACVPETRIIFMVPKRPCAKIAKLTHTHPHPTHTFEDWPRKRLWSRQMQKAAKHFAAIKMRRTRERGGMLRRLSSAQLNSTRMQISKLIMLKLYDKESGRKAEMGRGGGWSSLSGCSFVKLKEL